MFTLSFGHSKSKNYPKALNIANEIGGVMDKGVMHVSFHEYELLSAYEKLMPLMQVVSKWRDVSATYKGRRVEPFKFVFQIWRNIVECSQKRNETWDKRHCWNNADQEGWGCKLLNPFSRHIYGNGNY